MAKNFYLTFYQKLTAVILDTNQAGAKEVGRQPRIENTSMMGCVPPTAKNCKNKFIIYLLYVVHRHNSQKHITSEHNSTFLTGFAAAAMENTDRLDTGEHDIVSGIKKLCTIF
jgi:hypothetical protein